MTQPELVIIPNEPNKRRLINQNERAPTPQGLAQLHHGFHALDRGVAPTVVGLEEVLGQRVVVVEDGVDAVGV